MKENNLELPFEKWIVSFFTSWVSKVIRKTFALSTFQTLVTQIPWGKGHFVFLQVNVHGPKWIILFSLYTIYFMDTEIVSIIRKLIFLYYFFSLSLSSSSFIYKLSVAHSLFTFVLSKRPWRHTVYFPDGFFLFSLKIKSPLCGGCSNHHACCLKNSLKVLIIQYLKLRNGTTWKGWIWKKIRDRFDLPMTLKEERAGEC